jgi:hypothetical protein
MDIVENLKAHAASIALKEVNLRNQDGELVSKMTDCCSIEFVFICGQRFVLTKDEANTLNGFKFKVWNEEEAHQ